MHSVVVLALDGVVPFDLGIACEVFGTARLADDAAAYRVEVCGASERVRSQGFSIEVPHGLDRIEKADTVVVPGIYDPGRAADGAVLDAIRAAWTAGARLVSICSGAFVLAQTGLLDGRRATTHWRGAADFARRFPAVELDPAVLFVDEGRIVTSAGASAGMDMCLHLIACDHGQAVAAHSARLAVAPLQRDGGQAQFIPHDPPRTTDSLAPLLDWMLANLDKRLDVEGLASRAAMSPRTFARRFRQQTGTTPLQWILAARIHRAQERLETGDESIEEIAKLAGFEAPVTFRTRFQQIVGLSPAAYRRRFRSGTSPRCEPNLQERRTSLPAIGRN